MNKKRKKSYCFNCKVSLGKEDNFCRRCGQENHDKMVSFKMLLNDFLGDYFTFDSKIWRSLKLLCFSPGELTVKYAEGEITNYIRPIRLMLFLSLVYVVTLNLLLDDLGIQINNSSLSLDNYRVDEIYSIVITEYEGDVDEFIRVNITDDYGARTMVRGSYYMVASGKNIFNEIVKQTSNMLFVLLPIVGLIFKVTFRRNNKLYAEHFSHVLHIYSLFFLVFTVALLFSWLLSIPYYLFILVIFGFYSYLFLSYRKVYQRTYFVTLLKVISSTGLFFVILSLGFVLSSMLVISMY